MTYHNSAGVVI